jgi:hypothetical protein
MIRIIIKRGSWWAWVWFQLSFWSHCVRNESETRLTRLESIEGVKYNLYVRRLFKEAFKGVRFFSHSVRCINSWSHWCLCGIYLKVQLGMWERNDQQEVSLSSKTPSSRSLLVYDARFRNSQRSSTRWVSINANLQDSGMNEWFANCFRYTLRTTHSRNSQYMWMFIAGNITEYIVLLTRPLNRFLSAFESRWGGFALTQKTKVTTKY